MKKTCLISSSGSQVLSESLSYPFHLTKYRNFPYKRGVHRERKRERLEGKQLSKQSGENLPLYDHDL